MNGLKALKGTAVALLTVALAGCGQAYNPGPEEHLASPRDVGDVFNSNPDTAPYRTVSYETLRSLLVDFLGVNPNAPNLAGTPCAAPLTAATCPLLAPVVYLDANRNALGTAIYTADPLGTQAPSLMTSGGFKVWILASSSACGLAMQNDAKRNELFPNGVSDYTYFYQALLGRSPKPAEIQEFDMLQASFGDDVHKAAAVCATAMVTLENLSAN